MSLPETSVNSYHRQDIIFQKADFSSLLGLYHTVLTADAGEYRLWKARCVLSMLCFDILLSCYMERGTEVLRQDGLNLCRLVLTKIQTCMKIDSKKQK